MSKLDHLEGQRILDETLVDETTELLPLQYHQTLSEVKNLKLPKEYKDIDHVVVNGMGGSNLGAYIVKSLFIRELKVPITIEPGYDVPGFTNSKTLYILSSFSGNTEETLSVFEKARKKKAKILGITAKGNGKLEHLMHQYKIPGYIFEPKFDLAMQPRLGIGYSVFGLAALMSKAGVFKFDFSKAEEISKKLDQWSKKLRAYVPAKSNPAKKLALEIYGKIPVFIGSEHLTGNLHAMRNQINETSKLFATYLTLPDMNHHALEGLQHPNHIQDDLVFVFFDSIQYNHRIQKRSRLTREVAEKNHIKTVQYKVRAGDRLLESLEVLQLGTWLSFYLSVLYDTNPQVIPWVDWFKKKLG